MGAEMGAGMGTGVHPIVRGGAEQSQTLIVLAALPSTEKLVRPRPCVTGGGGGAQSAPRAKTRVIATRTQGASWTSSVPPMMIWPA